MHTKQCLFLRIVVTLGALLAIASATQAAPQAPQGEPVTIGQRYKIESKVLGETRSYIVHKPQGYDFSNDSYSLVVLLDGDANIHHVSASTDFLANSGRALPMIVVGIENTDRQRDLTPPLTGAPPQSMPSGKVGGAPKFLSFIADELIPYLDRTYRTRPTRILIGHSYGGLFAVYALFNRPEVFKAYIAVSPSLSWDDQALTKQADKFVVDHKDLRAAMYMTMGHEGGPMLGGAQKIIGSLASSRGGIGAEFQHWPEESHGSIVMRSVYKGLEWLHEPYYIHDPVRAYEESGLQFFDKRFALISKYLGYEVKAPETVLMNVQERLREMQRPTEALAVLDRVLQLYPHSSGARYELGKTFLDTDDKQRAEAEFRRTLAEFPGNISVRTALEKLGVDPRTIVVDAQLAPGVLRSYVGEYRYSDETSQVTFEDGKLFMNVRRDQHELRPQSAVDFYAMDTDRKYTFHKKAGRTTSVTVHLPEFEYDSVKVK